MLPPPSTPEEVQAGIERGIFNEAMRHIQTEFLNVWLPRAKLQWNLRKPLELPKKSWGRLSREES